MASSIDSKTSRFAMGGVTEQFPNRLGWWERNIMEFQNDDIIITIDEQLARRPEYISQMVYGTTAYRWVVLQYNTILDINTELVPGAVIRLPTQDRLL